MLGRKEWNKGYERKGIRIDRYKRIFFRLKKYVVDTVILLCHVSQFIYIELENLNTKEIQFTVPGVVHVYP